MKEKCGKEPCDIEKVSFQFSHLMGLLMWAGYQGIIVILLINILIAMMNNTFNKISDHADLEWKYSKSCYQAYFLSGYTKIPPPLTVVYYFAKLVRYLRKQCSCTNNGQLRKERREKEKDAKCNTYMRLLKKLVETKQHFDHEKSIDNSFIDLRKDMENIINEKLQKL